MIASHLPASIVQALIFLALLGGKVDPVLLVGNIAALTIGGLIGVRLVYRARAWMDQGTVALALILAAIFYTLANLGLMPIGGTAASLPPGLTLIAIAASFGFGILLNFGVGNYAPTLALLSLMGLDPRYCFPIMAASAGLSGVIVASRHVQAGKLDLRIVLGIALGGIPAVLIAAFLMKSMPLEMLRWLVTLVVLYTAVVMLRSAADGAIQTRRIRPWPPPRRPGCNAPPIPHCDFWHVAGAGHCAPRRKVAASAAGMTQAGAGHGRGYFKAFRRDRRSGGRGADQAGLYQGV